MSHPLTDELMTRIHNDRPVYDERDMRACADWQLEQCVEWLATLDPQYILAAHSTLARMMKDAMRPTAQGEES